MDPRLKDDSWRVRILSNNVVHDRNVQLNTLISHLSDRKLIDSKDTDNWRNF